MGKRNVIGKRIRVKLGGEPPKEDDAIVGDDVTVHISSEDLGRYDSIIGEKIEVRAGGDVDQIVQEIMSTAQASQIEKRDEIVPMCREILEEKDQKKKFDKIAALISIASGIAKLAQLIVQLRGLFPA